MTTPQTLVQAALNRLTARLGSGLADAAAGFAVLAQDAPDRLRQEWDLFREEVELEAQRLERGDTQPSHATAPSYATAPSTGAAEPPLAADPFGADPACADPQDQIDQLRAQVARLARHLEDQP